MSCLLYNSVVSFSGRVEPGLPPFKFPSLSVTKDNTTVHFPEMVKELGLAVIMAPVVMVLANVAIAKAFCKFICYMISNKKNRFITTKADYINYARND